MFVAINSLNLFSQISLHSIYSIALHSMYVMYGWMKSLYYSLQIFPQSPLLMSSMPEVEGYNVTLYNEDHQLIFTVLHSQTTFNLSEVDIDLKFRENYTISISAINSVGYGPPSDSTFGM